MKRKFIYIVLVLFYVQNKTFSQNNLSGSTIRIYANIGNDKVKQGTGFITRLNNKNYIITCYHVISGCEKIDAYSIKIGNISKVTIVGIDADKDIAILDGLRINEVQPILLSSKAVTSNISGKAIGNPNKISEQEFPVNFTYRDGLIKANQLFDGRGNEIYKISATFDLIPFTISSIYPGMSGSPILVNNESVGLVSGSLNIGGSLSWAIPAKYISKVSLTLNLQSGLTLKPSTLFENNFYRSFVINRNNITNFEPVSDVTREMEKEKSDILFLTKLQNRIIDKLLEKFENVQSYGFSEQKGVDIKQLHDSLIYYNTLSLSSYNTFINSSNTFDQIFAQLTKAHSESNDAQEIDLGLLEEIDKEVKLNAIKTSVSQTKYENKKQEVEWAKTLVPFSITTYADMTDRVPSWINYLTLLRQENNYLGEVVIANEDERLLFANVSDLLVESLMYKTSE